MSTISTIKKGRNPQRCSNCRSTSIDKRTRKSRTKRVTIHNMLKFHPSDTDHRQDSDIAQSQSPYSCLYCPRCDGGGGGDRPIWNRCEFDSKHHKMQQFMHLHFCTTHSHNSHAQRELFPFSKDDNAVSFGKARLFSVIRWHLPSRICQSWAHDIRSTK